jgi:iron complex transport system ATP-binding protein
MDSAKTSAVEIANVSFEVGAQRLVDSVELRIEAGQMIGILGANGAGKSTLLKLISGELEPTSGAILLDGVPVSKTDPAFLARRRAVVPQSSQLTFPFTAIEVVTLGASVPGFGLGKSHPAAEQALTRVGLLDFAHRRYTDLSGGERQRVHVARAMCQLETARRRTGETPVLLVDEPTSNLDIGHQRLVLSAVREIAADGAAVIAVLHDINLAAGYCDRLALMRTGKIVAHGKPSEIVRDDLLSDAYGCHLDANTTPTRTPFVLPITRDDIAS